MTIPSTETLSQVAQIVGARDVEITDRNAARLLNWQRRLFRDPVYVPVAIEPPKWPAFRSSFIEAASNITPIRKGSGRS